MNQIVRTVVMQRQQEVGGTSFDVCGNFIGALGRQSRAVRGLQFKQPPLASSEPRLASPEVHWIMVRESAGHKPKACSSFFFNRSFEEQVANEI